MTAPDVFRRITLALQQAGISYMLVGSFASTYYGAPRSTQDIDIVIAPTAEQLRAFIDLLPPAEYYADLQAALAAAAHETMFNVLDQATGWKIDFIIRKARPFDEEEFRRRAPAQLHGVSLFVASPEDVVISKLEWAKRAQSSRQIEDVAGILRARWHSLDRPYIQQWVSELDLTALWEAARNLAGVSTDS